MSELDRLRDAAIETMKAEIAADVHEGTIPGWVLSFSELHDYLDANMYADEERCAAEELIGDDDVDARVGWFNSVTDVVEKWMADGMPLEPLDHPIEWDDEHGDMIVITPTASVYMVTAKDGTRSMWDCGCGATGHYVTRGAAGWFGQMHGRSCEGWGTILPEGVIPEDSGEQYKEVFTARNGVEIEVTDESVWVRPPENQGLYPQNVEGGSQELTYGDRVEMWAVGEGEQPRVTTIMLAWSCPPCRERKRDTAQWVGIHGIPKCPKCEKRMSYVGWVPTTEAVFGF